MKKSLFRLSIAIFIFVVLLIPTKRILAATTFMDPGGESGFVAGTIGTGGLWVTDSNTLAHDFTFGQHQTSYKSVGNESMRQNGIQVNAGGRWTVHTYINALPTATATIHEMRASNGSTKIASLRVTSAGVLQLWNGVTAQIGSDGPTLNANQWYRISVAYTLTSTSVNRFEVFVDGVSAISVTNATLGSIGANTLTIGNSDNNATLDLRFDDIYVDSSTSLTDPGDIRETAKRPVANGTTNGYSTQIGSGGSGYGTGHSPQVNERAVSSTNGWSMVGSGSAVTEEYNIEGASVGDIDISSASLVDYMGWMYTKSLAAETTQFILNGNNTGQAITTSGNTYKLMAGSTSYPAGTGSDIGQITATSLTTVSLYDTGIVFAYTPPVSAVNILQQVSASKGSSGTTLALSIKPTPGSTLILTYGNGGSATANSITTNGTGTWVKAAGNAGAAVWYLQNTDGSDTSFTLTQNSGASASATILEVTGLAQTGTAIDGTNTNSGTSVSPDTSTITPTAGEGLFIVAALGNTTVAPQTPPTNGFYPTATNAVEGQGAYSYVPSTSGSYSTQWTEPSSHGWGTAIAGFVYQSANTTTIGNGTDPSNATIAPGGGATMADAFTLQTSASTDSATAVTVALGSGAHTGISLVEITDDGGSTVYGSASNPSSDTSVVTLSTPISVTTSSTQYKIRITPLSHANMPPPPGATYVVTPTIAAFAVTNSTAGTDSSSATIAIDNTSPGEVTSATVAPGNTQNSLSWADPSDVDFANTIVLRATSTVNVFPTEGSSYSVGNTLNSTTTVVCVTSSTSCTDTGLTNGTAYYYQIFTVDIHGNFSSTGVVPTGSPATPVSSSLTVGHYRWRADNGSESGATYLASEDTAYTAGAIGDRVRLRFQVANTGGNNLAFQYLLEQSSSTNVWIPVPNYGNAGNSHWVMDVTSNYVNTASTTDSSGVDNPGSGTFTPGYAMSAIDQTPSQSLTTTQFTELEYSIRSTSNVTPGTTYSFRLSNAGDASVFTYSVTPQISVTTAINVKNGGGGAGSFIEAPGTGPVQSGGNEGGGGGSIDNGGGGGGSHGGGGQGGGGGIGLYLGNFEPLFVQKPDFIVGLFALR